MTQNKFSLLFCW